MTVGPYGAAFGGRPFVPGSEPAAQARPSIAYAPAHGITDGWLAAYSRPFALRASFDPPTSGRAWLVRRLTVTCTVNGPARVFVGNPADPSSLASGTENGGFDENESTAGYFVPEATQLSVVWMTATINDSAGVRIEYVEL